MRIFLVLISIFIVNVFFGYWRSNTKKFTLQWILAIHIPVPLAIGLRLLFLGWSWIMVPIFVATFFAGQYMGGMIRHLLLTRQNRILTSSLAIDIIKIFWQ